MNHVVWHICNPDFRFPCQLFGEFLECLEIKKSRHIYFPAVTLLVMDSISNIRLGSIGPTEVTDSTKYTQFLSSR